MDRTERLAHQHLQHRQLGEIVYEPDGNVPPDFAVDSRIAVEVRRLDQLEPGGKRGVDETGRPFADRVKSILASYGQGSEAHWLALRFRRPTPRSRSSVAQAIDAFVRAILTGEVEIGTVHPIGDHAELQYLHRNSARGDLVRIGTVLDYDSGGFLIPQFRRSLELCVTEKSRKTAALRPKYPEWWLLLVDELSYGLSVRDRDDFFALEPLQSDWDRIIIVNPLDVSVWFEIDGDGGPPNRGIEPTAARYSGEEPRSAAAHA